MSIWGLAAKSAIIVTALSGALLFCAFPASAAPAEYQVLVSGLPSGVMSVTSSAAVREVRYSFNDRGRGSDVVSTVEVGKDLLPVRLTVTGVDYYKLPVDERFERVGARGVWKASTDAGEMTQPGFYLPGETTPEHLAMLARALLKAPGGRLDLLPGGRAGIQHLADHDVRIDGRPLKARLYALSGLGFGAQPIWLDADGELLMSGNDWSATVLRGAEGEAKALIRLQREKMDALDTRRAKDLQRRPEGVTAFRNVSVFDAEAKTMRPGSTVLVRNKRIVAVGPMDQVAIPAGAEQVDGRGRALLPGLWDMHVHVSSNAQGMLHLAAGVTTVRDLANNLDELLERRRRFTSGELIGPRIVPAGFIDGPGPLAGPIKVLVSTPDEMRAAVRDYAVMGYPQIKLYSSLDPKLVPVAAEEARRLGMKVSGHVPAGMTMREAVEAGLDEVHHLNFAALNFMGPEINAKTNGITRITAIAEHAGDLDLESGQVKDFIAFLKARGTTVDPTFSLYEGHLLGRPGKPAPSLVAVVDRLPPVVRRGAFGAGLAKTDAEAARNAVAFRKMQGLLKALHAAGVTMVPGTDAMPGFTYHRELELYAEAGIPNLDVLQMATLGSARVAGRDADLGSITPGKRADLILVDGDPAQRMSDIRKVDLVMKGGVVIEPAALLKELGVAP